MNVFKLIAIVMILAGTQGLLYGSYYHFNADHEVLIDATEQLIRSDSALMSPIWAGLGAIVTGIALFLYGIRYGIKIRNPSKHR